jgi:hypothetical protein
MIDPQKVALEVATAMLELTQKRGGICKPTHADWAHQFGMTALRYGLNEPEMKQVIACLPDATVALIATRWQP